MEEWLSIFQTLHLWKITQVELLLGNSSRADAVGTQGIYVYALSNKRSSTKWAEYKSNISGKKNCYLGFIIATTEAAGVCHDYTVKPGAISSIYTVKILQISC